MSATAPKLHECKRVLVVEGYSDLLFYAEVLEALQRLQGVFIKEFGGRPHLATKLETFLSPGLLAEKAAIGVIIDADNEPAGTRQSFAARLSKITGQRVEAGCWTAGSPSIGLFIVPGGDKKGEIETLVWEAWSKDPSNADTRTCVDSFLDCMARQGHEAKSEDKGRISALLSVLNDEDPRLGPGARDQKGRRVFDFDRPEYLPLLNFLKHLCDPETC